MEDVGRFSAHADFARSMICRWKAVCQNLWVNIEASPPFRLDERGSYGFATDVIKPADLVVLKTVSSVSKHGVFLTQATSVKRCLQINPQILVRSQMDGRM